MAESSGATPQRYDKPLRIGWFATARGTTSGKLLDAALKAIEGGLNAEIAFVFTNREPGGAENSDRFFDQVRVAGIPLLTLSDTSFRRSVSGDVARKGQPLPAWRRDYDLHVAEMIAPYGMELGVMAGYMLIITEALHDRWPIVNLHPALPDGPIGIWQDVIYDLIVAKATESGVHWFLSTGQLDRGPVISYCRYPLRGGDIDRLWAEHGNRPIEDLRAEGESNPLFAAIRARGIARELPLLVETLRAFAEGEVRARPTRPDPAYRVVNFWGEPIRGFDLTAQVEAAVLRVPQDEPADKG